jgi:hypothetical protein
MAMLLSPYYPRIVLRGRLFASCGDYCLGIDIWRVVGFLGRTFAIPLATLVKALLNACKIDNAEGGEVRLNRKGPLALFLIKCFIHFLNNLRLPVDGQWF